MKNLSILFSTTAFVTVSASLAFGQTTTTTTASTVDLSPWLQDLVGIAAISVPVFLTTIGTWAKAHFKMAAGSNAANIIDLFVAAGKQYAAGALAKAPLTVSPIDVKNQAVAEFLNQISASTQAAMTLKGVTIESIAQRIDGELTNFFPSSVVVAPTPSTVPTTTSSSSKGSVESPAPIASA